ncbi:MAG: integrin alpha [Myxococcota bacterium]
MFITGAAVGCDVTPSRAVTTLGNQRQNRTASQPREGRQFYLPDGEEEDAFGSSVAGGEDIDGDGYSDIVITAYYRDRHGTAYVYYGSTSGLMGTPVELKSKDTTSSYHMAFGFSSTLSDIDGNGYADIILSAPSILTPDEIRGAALGAPHERD